MVRTTKCSVALGAALVFLADIEAQEGARPGPADPAPIEEIVVLGKALEELRIRIELAEDAFYARFNEINSNDRFDIHCYERPATGSRIQGRTCLSNAWREAGQEAANAIVRDLQSTAMVAGGSGGSTSTGVGAAGYSHIPQQYRAKQLIEKNLVVDEMRRLAEQDPELKAAMESLGRDYQALAAMTGSPPAEWTLFREVDARDASLPPEARRRFDVRIGSAPWRHSLSARTFTIASVDGRIRRMLVECDATETRLEYQAEVDWTIPQAWGACTVEVNAKSGTTFALFELE
jgi:hypothetical protein